MRSHSPWADPRCSNPLYVAACTVALVGLAVAFVVGVTLVWLREVWRGLFPSDRIVRKVGAT